MPLHIEPYGKEPILMVTFSGETSQATFHEMYHRCAQHVQAMDAPIVWRLINLDKADISFATIIQSIREISLTTTEAGSFSDPRLRTVFSTPHPMARLTSELLSKVQYGGLSIPVFPGLGEALIYVEDQIYGSPANSAG